MNCSLKAFAAIALILSVAARVSGSVYEDLSTAQQVARSVAVVRGTVLKTESYVDPAMGCINTRAWIRVDEALKGKCPPVLTVIHSGGVVGKVGQMDGFSPQLLVGEERLFFLTRRKDGALTSIHGGASAVKLRRAPGGDFPPEHATMLQEVHDRAALARASTDVTDQAALLPNSPAVVDSFGGGASSAVTPPTYTNLIQDPGVFNFSSRFVDPDRGLPLHYLVDGQAMPSGITSNQALTAVQNAFKAWSNVTALQFVFDGWTNLGNSVLSQTNLDGTSRYDGRIRIQLHNLYGAMLESGTLGFGGWSYSSQTVGTNTNTWGSGGNVRGNEFLLSLCGYVVLDHTNINGMLANTNRLAEVLCHEIGHVLSLAHTSTNSAESTNSALYQSIMYYRVHTDTNRGATLGAIDGPNVRQVYPITNTPPFLYRRVLDIVTGNPVQPTNPGINQIELRAIDLQGAALTLATNQPYDTNGVVAGTNGVFMLTGNLLKYTPLHPATGPRLDPSGLLNGYERIFARCSDGTNASAFVAINIVSYDTDTFPLGQGDGLPDNWMTTYFGSPIPGPNMGPDDEFDGDGLTNLQEFLLGTNPADFNSKLKITSFSPTGFQFSSRPYDLYEVQSSSDLIQWTRATNAILPTTTNVSVTGLPTNSAQLFHRVLRVP